MARRTDPHRKGAIVPGEYEFVLYYDCATTMDGWRIPSYGINCELDRRVTDQDGRIVQNGEHNQDGKCCVVGLLHIAKVKFAEYGGTGKCTACGAHFAHGEVWRHVPTGEHVHLGHTCAERYGMLTDRSAFELEAGRRAKATATHLKREQNDRERQEFLDDNPGLAEALETDHHIVHDIKARFQQYRELSPKQVALVFKLANEAANPEPEEQHVPAPEGKQTFRGKVVSVKSEEGYYGWTTKTAIKVQTSEGSWIAWGTAPRALLDAVSGNGGLRGCEVEITATLTRSDRDEHFAFMKRPRGKLLAHAKDE